MKGYRFLPLAGQADLVAALCLAPAAGAHSKTAREHQVEEAQGLVAALHRHVHDLRFRGCQQFARPRQPQFGVFVAKRGSHHLVEDAAQMSWGATGHPRQFSKIQGQRLMPADAAEIPATALWHPGPRPLAALLPEVRARMPRKELYQLQPEIEPAPHPVGAKTLHSRRHRALRRKRPHPELFLGRRRLKNSARPIRAHVACISQRIVRIVVPENCYDPIFFARIPGNDVSYWKPAFHRTATKASSST